KDGGKEGAKPNIRLRMVNITADERTNTVHINAPADKIAQAKTLLAQIDVQTPPQGPAVETKVITLSLLDATKTVDNIKNIVPGAKNGDPYMEPDTSRNAIIVRASPQQVKEIIEAINALGEKVTGGGSGGIRIFSLEKGGGAGVLAEEMARML